MVLWEALDVQALGHCLSRTGTGWCPPFPLQRYGRGRASWTASSGRFSRHLWMSAVSLWSGIRMWRDKLEGVKDQGELTVMGGCCAKTCMRLLLSQGVYGRNRPKRVSGRGKREWGRDGVMCQRSVVKPRPGPGLVNTCLVSWAEQVTSYCSFGERQTFTKSITMVTHTHREWRELPSMRTSAVSEQKLKMLSTLLSVI